MIDISHNYKYCRLNDKYFSVEIFNDSCDDFVDIDIVEEVEKSLLNKHTINELNINSGKDCYYDDLLYSRLLFVLIQDGYADKELLYIIESIEDCDRSYKTTIYYTFLSYIKNVFLDDTKTSIGFDDIIKIILKFKKLFNTINHTSYREGDLFSNISFKRKLKVYNMKNNTNITL